MKDRLLVSASRTRDMVRNSPDLLAAMLEGKAEVRFSLAGPVGRIDPAQVGAVALWTRDPVNMKNNPALKRALGRLVNDYGAVILLNLTVTGLAGTPLEPGMPDGETVRRAAAELIESQIISPRGIVLRYDPIIKVACGRGSVLGNASTVTFKRAIEGFLALGVERVKASLVHYGYRHVPKRLAACSLQPQPLAEDEAVQLFQQMASICSDWGVKFAVCCNPSILVSDQTYGCVDGRLINELLEERGSPARVTETLHNELGKQRPLCRCTYSLDIGHSPGVKSCFAGTSACLYCYSHRNGGGAVLARAKALLAS